MKRLLVAGLLTAGLLGFASNEASAQYYGGYYGGYYGSYYPSYYSGYYGYSSYPGLSLSFRYYDNDRYRRSYYGHGHSHRRHHYDRHDRYDRRDRYDRYDRYRRR